jgi:Holliday junction resolvasome RuvABC endonuclease subunit
VAAAKLILALDLSTKVGFAVARDFDAPVYGTWILPKEHGGIGKRMSSFAASLEDAIQVHRPELVILEAPLPPQAQTAMASARIQFGLAAVGEMICHEQAVECEEARADDVRRLVLGTARPGKDRIVAWCREQGWAPPDDNAADALALLRYRHTLGRTRVMAGAGAA